MKIPKPVKTKKAPKTPKSQAADLERQLQEALAANAQLQKRNKKLRNGKVPVVPVKTVGKGSDKKQRELEAKVAALEAREHRAKLRRIRDRLIADYNGQIIPDLIVGETKAELIASAENAHRVWKRTLKTAGAIEDDDDDEDDTESDEDDEDEEDEDLDNDDEEEEDDDEEDESDEDDEPVTRRSTKQRPVSRATGQRGNNRAPVPSRKPTAKVPTVPTAMSRQQRGGVRRDNPRNSLVGVKTWSPGQYREKREEVLAQMESLYPREK